MQFCYDQDLNQQPLDLYSALEASRLWAIYIHDWHWHDIDTDKSTTAPPLNSHVIQHEEMEYTWINNKPDRMKHWMV